MDVVDAQVHAWAPNSEVFPWDPEFATRDGLSDVRQRMEDNAITAETLVAMMQSAGVEAALLTSSPAYGCDHRYAFDVASRYPDIFGVVGPVSLAMDNVEGYVQTFRERPGGIGIRLTLRGEIATDDDAFTRIYEAARKGAVPICVNSSTYLVETGNAARLHPNVLFLLDHLGHGGPYALEPELDKLPTLLTLAACDNVIVKCTCAPKFSRESYPFEDLWPQLEAILEAFGPERVAWGSDITTVTDNRYSYREAVDYMRCSDHLTPDEKELVLGKSLRRLLRWPAPG